MDIDKIDFCKCNVHKQFITFMKYNAEIASFSKDGELLAVVNNDLTITMFDCKFIWVPTKEYMLFSEDEIQFEKVNQDFIFIDWSADNKSLYFIVDTHGFIIDAYKGCVIKRFFLPNRLTSFICHPHENDLCLITTNNKLIETNYITGIESLIYDYNDMSITSDMNSKRILSSFAIYIPYSTRILLWISNTLFCYDKITHQQIKQITLKLSTPCASRISIDSKGTFFIVTNRSEITGFHIHDFVPFLSYKDTVNQVTWKSCSINPDSTQILGIPSGFQTGTPIFILYDKDDNTQLERFNEPFKEIKWAMWQPVVGTLVVCTSSGELMKYQEFYDTKFAGSYFPPNFEKLENNIIYEEKEDDFDFMDPIIQIDENDTYKWDTIDIMNPIYNYQSLPVDILIDKSIKQQKQDDYKTHLVNPYDDIFK
ncbi:hypothetical protein WA158_008503 [Blastocystis sp. Blastoise]